MSLSLAVLSIPCFFTVESAVHRHHIAYCPPFSLGILPASRSPIEAARYPLESHPIRARRSRHVGYQTVSFRPVAPLLSLLTPFLTSTKMIKINFNIIKCNHFYGQLPSPALVQPTISAVNVGKCGGLHRLRHSSFVLRL